jgi:hypothetical protein
VFGLMAGNLRLVDMLALPPPHAYCIAAAGHLSIDEDEPAQAKFSRKLVMMLAPIPLTGGIFSC